MALTKAKLIADGVIVAANLHSSHGITSANIGENTNLYFTDARARSAISVSGNALSYNSSTGVITSNFEESPTFTGNVAISGNLTMNNAGNIQIGGYNSGNDRGIIFTPADASGYWHIYNDAGGSLAFGANSTIGSSEKMRITGSGNVGIGTSSPSHSLHVVSAGNGEIKAERTSGAAMLIQAQSALGRFGTTTNHNLQFMANSNGWMTITTAGNVGIGLTSPAVKLEIQDSTHTTMKIRSGNNDNILFAQALQSDEARIGTDTNSAISFFTNTGRRMTITTSGLVGIGTNLPQSSLHISTSATNAPIRLQNDNGSGSTANYVLQTDSSGLGNNGFGIYDVAQSAYRFVINGSGNVGIGATSPSQKLHVVGDQLIFGDLLLEGSANSFRTVSMNTSDGSDNQTLSLCGGATASSARGGRVEIKGNEADGSVVLVAGNVSTGDIDFYTANTQRMIINNAGSVGIGTTSLGTEAKLAIGATNVNEGGQIVLHKGTSGTLAAHIDAYHSTHDYLRILSGTNTASSSAPFVFDLTNVRVGIGNTSPSVNLHIASNNPKLRLQDTDGGYTEISGNNTDLVIRVDPDDAVGSSTIQFEIDGSEYMRLQQQGRLGIGTTSPAKTLDVRTDNGVLIKGASGTTNAHLSFLPASGGREYAFSNDGSSFYIKDISADVTRLYFHYNGNVGIGTTSPSAKLEVLGTAPTYTNSSTVFWGGTTNNDNHNGIMLSSYGDALGGSLASNLLYSNSNTPTQTNGSRSSGEIKFGNTTTASKTSDIIFGGYYKGTTTFVEKMRTDGDGVLQLTTTSNHGFLNANGTSLELDVNRHPETGAFSDTGKSHARINLTGVSGGSYIIFNTASANNTTASERMRVTSNGITFNGDTAAANALDDYEEGTFTPAIGDGTYSYSYRRGHYQKIGNTVHIHIGFKINQASSVGTGVARITGLPFAGMGWGSYQEPHERCGVAGLCVTANLSYNLSFYISNSSAQLNGRTSANNADTQVNSNQVWQNGTFIKLQLSYTVS